MTRFIAIAFVLIALFVGLFMNHRRAAQSSSASPPQGDAFDQFVAEKKKELEPLSGLLPIALSYERGLNVPCCGGFPRLKDILLNQDFEGLSDLAKKEVLVRVYPDFARLPTLEQDKVIQFARLVTLVMTNSPCWTAARNPTER